MSGFRLAQAPISLRVLVTMALLGMALTYCILAVHIQIDTEYKVSLIKDAYGNMDWTELVDHTHKYFPYYGIYIFAFALFIFVLGTSYTEKLKTILVIVVNSLIVLDIGSMWGIRFISQGLFAWGLFFAGSLLAFSFTAIFFLTMYDIWIIKPVVAK